MIEFLPEFSTLIWLVIIIVILMVWVGSFLLFLFWFMPPISRKFIGIKWRSGSPCFIQHGGRVSVYSSSDELPEGVIHNRLGWFLKSAHPFGQAEKTKLEALIEKYKDDPEAERKIMEELKSNKKKYTWTIKKEKEIEDLKDIALDKVLRAPILDGLNKQVFFGSSDTALLSNLETLSEFTPHNPDKGVKHSLLTVLKEVIPATMSRTQLDALATLNYLRGLKAAKGETMKLLIIVACLIGLIGTVGLVFWFLTQ